MLNALLNTRHDEQEINRTARQLRTDLKASKELFFEHNQGIDIYTESINRIWVELDVLYRTYDITLNPDIRIRVFEDYSLEELNLLDAKEFVCVVDPTDDGSRKEVVVHAMLSQLCGMPFYAVTAPK